MMVMPRIQGKVGKVDEPGHKDHGRFVWVVYIHFIAPGHPPQEPITIESYTLADTTRNSWATEDEAKRDLEKAAEHMNSEVIKVMGGRGDEGFFDLKDNVHRFGFERKA